LNFLTSQQQSFLKGHKISERSGPKINVPSTSMLLLGYYSSAHALVATDGTSTFKVMGQTTNVATKSKAT